MTISKEQHDLATALAIAAEAIADARETLNEAAFPPYRVTLEWQQTPSECQRTGYYLLRERASLRFPDTSIDYFRAAGFFEAGEEMSPDSWPECCGPIEVPE